MDRTPRLGLGNTGTSGKKSPTTTSSSRRKQEDLKGAQGEPVITRAWLALRIKEHGIKVGSIGAEESLVALLQDGLRRRSMGASRWYHIGSLRLLLLRPPREVGGVSEARRVGGMSSSRSLQPPPLPVPNEEDASEQRLPGSITSAGARRTFCRRSTGMV